MTAIDSISLAKHHSDLVISLGLFSKTRSLNSHTEVAVCLHNKVYKYNESDTINVLVK